MSKHHHTKPAHPKQSVSDVLDKVAARQRELGIVVDEDEIAAEADKAVAEERELVLRHHEPIHPENPTQCSRRLL